MSGSKAVMPSTPDEQPGAASDDLAGCDNPSGLAVGTELTPVELVPLSEDDAAANRRDAERFAVGACRPIAIRALNGPEDQPGAWIVADILDLSTTGCCLLVMDGESYPVGQTVEIDVRAHPDFGLGALRSHLRWFVHSDFVHTVGLLFQEPLDRIPSLLPCRRSGVRDPLE
ncbi:PilZ domain-containing protein [Synechococcus sp. RSCCF101]|uniref:PilZ domain-containing protein n=1 Tax=Synechococcus sp. RSCCF101 TaxID=2511069 RepID=UPI0012478110|nr:PilZ domain-containing protein [Synechococcus sp. RSCCF101]QEY32631.1 PilZ domain-containing protein [Synechococcus sp. RSCCF101]